MSASNTPKFLKFCSLHEGEPIIRASLDPEDQQIFYCHECLENKSPDFESKLVKLTQLSQILHDQLTEKTNLAVSKGPGDDIKDVAIDRTQAYAEIDEMTAQQKQKVEDNLIKIEKCAVRILRIHAAEIQKRCDRLKSKVDSKVDLYVRGLALLSDGKSIDNYTVTKEELDKELASDEDVRELEKKMRARLDTISRLDQMAEGTAVQSLKKENKQLKPFLENFNVIPTPTEEYFQENLFDVCTFI